MSDFKGMARHPETGKVENADWMDDYFGRHSYGVRFSDGKVFPDREIPPFDETEAEKVSEQQAQRESESSHGECEKVE